MRGFRLFEKPLGVFSAVPPLRVVGSLPGYEQGTVYEGRLDIVDNIGKCTVELLDNNLPPGATAHVDNFNNEVVIRWPAYSLPDEEKAGILNWDFQLETLEGWNDLRGNSWSVKQYTGHGEPSTNYAAWMEGVGRGDHILESILYPAIPSEAVMARSLWDQGPSNKDNNNLWTAVQFYTPGKVRLGEPVYGDRIHDRTNKQRHHSTVNTTTPSGAGWKSVLLIAHRRNSRNRWITVDNVETAGFDYSTGVDNGDDFFLTVRVRDSANRVALWSGIIPYGSFFVTSKPYGSLFKEDLVVGGLVSDLLIKVGAIAPDPLESAGSVGASITGFVLREPVVPVEYGDASVVGTSIVGFTLRSPLAFGEAVDEASVQASITGFNYKNMPTAEAADAAVTSASITGFTLT